MDDQRLPHERPAAPELREAGPRSGRDESPVLYRTQPQVRSPLVESRPVKPLPRSASSDPPTLPLPSARAVARSAGWAALVALPLLLLIGWQVALVMGGLTAVARELDTRIRRANITFAEGFLPFRERTGWPRGVQEEDGVHWNWSPHARNGQGSTP